MSKHAADGRNAVRDIEAEYAIEVGGRTARYVAMHFCKARQQVAIRAVNDNGVFGHRRIVHVADCHDNARRTYVVFYRTARSLKVWSD